jgi:hypothetical protein
VESKVGQVKRNQEIANLREMHDAGQHHGDTRWTDTSLLHLTPDLNFLIFFNWQQDTKQNPLKDL